MTRSVALDTTAAVPFLMASHEAHDVIRAHLIDAEPVLTSHSLVETYSVLTRLPGDARLAAVDARRLIEGAFPGPTLALDQQVAGRIAAVLAPRGITGGAVYDALVGLAAAEASTSLVTRDRRAAATYAAIGVEVEIVPGV